MPRGTLRETVTHTKDAAFLRALYLELIGLGSLDCEDDDDAPPSIESARAAVLELLGA